MINYNDIGIFILAVILISAGVIKYDSIRASISAVFGYDCKLSVSEQVYMIVLILAIVGLVVTWL